MTIGVIGVGRLGLAYALLFEQAGFPVVASSYKQDYVENLQRRVTDSLEPEIAELLSASTDIEFTCDNHRVIDQSNLIYVMVATPSTDRGDYDTTAVNAVAQDFLDHPGRVDDKILIVGSTVNPGDCDRLQAMLDDRGVSVVYCPTFAAQGSVMKNIRDPHTMSLGSQHLDASEVCRELFCRVIAPDTPIYTMDTVTAEILKLAGNCRSTMEISFMNMIGQILLRNGLKHDIDTANKYLNFVKKQAQWQYGFGYGGPCYPRDNRAFVHYAQTLGMDYPLGRLVDQFNESHVDFLVDFLVKDNDRNLPFYFDHVSYKKGVAIFEESHQLKVCARLLALGHPVWIEDTQYLLPKIRDDLTRDHGDLVRFLSLSSMNAEVYKVN